MLKNILILASALFITTSAYGYIVNTNQIISGPNGISGDGKNNKAQVNCVSNGSSRTLTMNSEDTYDIGKSTSFELVYIGTLKHTLVLRQTDPTSRALSSMSLRVQSCSYVVGTVNICTGIQGASLPVTLAAIDQPDLCKANIISFDFNIPTTVGNLFVHSVAER